MASITWHKIAESAAELIPAENNIVVVEVRDKKICLTEHQGQWHGFAYKCPHAGGIMANGFIDAMGNIVCPLHRYRFSLKNGRNTSGEGYYLKTYPIEIRADGFYIGLATTGFFGF